MHRTTGYAAMRWVEFSMWEAIGRYGVGPITARLWDAGGGIGAQALDQTNHTPVASGVSQINALKFGGSPVH